MYSLRSKATLTAALLALLTASLILTGINTAEAENSEKYDVGPPRSSGTEKAEEDAIEEGSFSIEVQESVISAVRYKPRFSGNDFDFSGSQNKATVYLVDPSEEDREELRRRFDESEAKGELELREAAHSLTQLKRATESVADSWEEEFPDVELHEISIDVEDNELTAHVDKEAMEDETKERPLRETFEVDPNISLSEAVAFRDANHCSLRGYCTDPMHAGNRIFNGSNSGFICAMGFHVNTGNWKRFLTAGHCSWTASTDWHHRGMPGDGYLGAVTESAYGSSSGSRDVMVVSMPDSQVSNTFFHNSRAIGDSASVSAGQAVCAERAKSGGATQCGSVSDEWTYWTSNGCNCNQWGAVFTGISIDRGDSGSPVFTPIHATRVVAVGIVDTTGGHFARIDDAVSELVSVDSVYTG